MRIRNNKVSLNKKVVLLVVLLAGGLAFTGCAAGSVPRGWAGVEEANGTLFLGSMNGELVALNASSGARLWGQVLEATKKSTGFGCAPTSTSVAIYGTPAVTEDLVYVAGYNGKIQAFNSSSGALRWVYPREGNLQPIVGGIAVALDRLYFGGTDGKVYALDAATGDWQWEFQTDNKVWSTPVIHDDTIYIGSFDKNLYALSAIDGSKKWEFKTEGGIATIPLIHDNTVYIGSFDRHIYAVDAASGSSRWQSNFEAGNGFWAKPVIYNDVIYAPSLDNNVYVLDANTGNKVDEFDLGSPVSSSPVLVNSSIFIVSEEGKVYAIDTSNNQIRQLIDLEEKVYAPLSASEGVVYAHTQKRDILYALDAQTGGTLWSITLSSK